MNKEQRNKTTLAIERATQLGRRWTVSAQSRSPVKFNYKVIRLWIYMSNVFRCGVKMISRDIRC